MTPPPTSIDGTEITGATIDGQEVQEITVDGDTVFSAIGALDEIVSPSNLIAWYPFEGDASDETRTGGILDNFGIAVGDSTDYSLNVSAGSPTFSASDGVTDLQNGPKSGAFQFDGNDAFQENFGSPSNDFTITVFFKPDVLGTRLIPLEYNVASPSIKIDSSAVQITYFDGSTVHDIILDSNPSADEYVHVAMVNDTGANEVRGHLNGQPPLTNANDVDPRGNQFDVGAFKSAGPFFDGTIDDVRFYDKALSSSEINQIFENTKP